MKTHQTSVRRLATGALLVLLATGSAAASPLPPNEMWREDAPSHRISEDEFDDVLEQLESNFLPLFAFHGARFKIDRMWSSPTVNAFAKRDGDTWIVEMHGGLARRPEMTADGFAMTLCHEIGHHLGGYPFKGDTWASTEGQADWYAAQACARWLWLNDSGNAAFRMTAPQAVRDRCDAEWNTVVRQDLCYRIAVAGKSLADLLARNDTVKPAFGQNDPNVVTTTNADHPAPQCRLDTFENASLCTVTPDLDFIPGADEPLGRNSHAAELQAARNTCIPASAWAGAVDYNRQDHPTCWFAPLLN
jgi:hypothetical protein